MLRFAWIAFGGLAGTLLRVGTNSISQNISGQLFYFTATAMENIIGCFLMGFFYILLNQKGSNIEATRHFLLIGLVGSYTTYSGFGIQAVTLLQDSAFLFLLFILGQLFTGVFALLAGMKLADKMNSNR